MARRELSFILAALVALSACSAQSPTARKPVSTKASSTGRAATGPGGAPVVKSSVKPGPGSSLAPAKPSPTPVGPMTMLKGSVTVDAHYLLSNNAGSLISNNGSSTIVLHPGTLISDNGLGIISNNAGGIISDNGLGLISDNGLGLISDNGLGLISNNSGSYRLFDLGAAAADVPVGTILPVKGMVVLPISLRTGTIVGKPVFTDETGGYTLQVPESVAGNLRVVTRIAVAKASDPIATDNRAQYNLLVDTAKTDTAAPAPAAAIDEDSSVGSQYLRAAFAGRLKDIIVADDADAAAGELVKALGFSETIKTFLSGSVHELNQASKDAGVPSMAAADIDALSGRLTDILLSYVPVYTIMIDPAKYGKWGPEEPAFAGMVDVIKQVRLAATAKMAADPKAFDNAPWMAGAPFPKEIKKPSDVCDFVVANYLVSLNGEKGRTQDAFEGAGVPDAELQAHRINALSIGLLANVGQTLISNPEAKDKMIAAIKASKK